MASLSCPNQTQRVRLGDDPGAARGRARPVLVPPAAGKAELVGDQTARAMRGALGSTLALEVRRVAPDQSLAAASELTLRASQGAPMQGAPMQGARSTLERRASQR